MPPSRHGALRRIRAIAATTAWLLASAATAQTPGGWSALWHTPDQRGEAAMRAGDAATAARTYTDPRRRAYAQLQAGDHHAAAETYAAVDAAEALYNRGNALARAGDLQRALQAYDAALAKNPADRDAEHNRELVARALRPPPSGGGPSRGSSPRAGGPGSAPTAQPATGPAGQGQGPAARGTGDGGTGGPGADGRGQATTSDGAPDPNGIGATARGEPSSEAEAEQARRDVARPRPRAAPADGNPSPPSAVTEQQLAEDQWLRRLPDDPSALLRRKFLIQHLIRQGSPP